MGEDCYDRLSVPRKAECFPNLLQAACDLTSDVDQFYNCIGWALGLQQWWEPDWAGDYHWPEGVPRRYDLAALIQACATEGFVACADGAPQAGVEKIAVYCTDDGIPRHAARQLPSGRWWSKLGVWEDIQHELGALEGPEYGRVAQFLARRGTRVRDPGI